GAGVLPCGAAARWAEIGALIRPTRPSKPSAIAFGIVCIDLCLCSNFRSAHLDCQERPPQNRSLMTSVLRMLAAAAVLPVLMAAPVERRLYVAEDRGGVSVYDIDRGHQFLRKIDVPNSGAYKGIAASASLGRLYLTSNAPDTLICLDLATDREIWRKTL